MISAVSGRERGGPGGPPLDKREKHGRIKVKREPHQQAVSPDLMTVQFQERNRHLPEWRFLLFTIIVTVKDPICNVIRMRNTSLPGGVADRLPSVWMARTSSDQILPEKTDFVNFL